MFTLIIETYQVTVSTAIYMALTVVIVQTEAISQVDYMVYGRLRIVRSPSSMAIKAIMCVSGSRHLCAVNQFLYTQVYTVTLSLRSSTAW